MKKILIILILLCIPLVSGVEMYTTKVNVTINDSGNKVIIIGEENAYLEMSTNSSATNTMTIFLYRNDSFEEDLNDLANSYDNLTTLYTQCIGSIDKLNKTLDQNRSSYYEKYTDCYFSLLSTNLSLTDCEDKKETCENASAIYFEERNDYLTQRDNYRTQYTNCNDKLGDYTGIDCGEDLSSKNLNFLWGFLLAVAIVGGLWGFNNQKKKPTTENPIGEMENLEEPF